MNVHERRVAYQSRVRKAEATVGFADISAAAMTKFLDLAALLLPADAFLLGHEMNVLTDFDDGAAATNKLDIGVSGATTSFLAGSADNLGTIARTNGGTVGAAEPSFQGGAQVRLSFTSSVNTSTLTQGSVLVRIFYVRTDKLIPDVDR
jgi:hypothetical protein